MRGTTQNLDAIGSAVSINKQTNKQIDRQASKVYIKKKLI